MYGCIYKSEPLTLTTPDTKVFVSTFQRSQERAGIELHPVKSKKVFKATAEIALP